MSQEQISAEVSRQIAVQLDSFKADILGAMRAEFISMCALGKKSTPKSTPKTTGNAGNIPKLSRGEGYQPEGLTHEYRRERVLRSEETDRAQAALLNSWRIQDDFVDQPASELYTEIEDYMRANVFELEPTPDGFPYQGTSGHVSHDALNFIKFVQPVVKK